MKTIISITLVAGLLIVTGCASYSGSSLVPGAATQAEVRQVMGEPAAIHKADKGEAGQTAESWEFPRGPAGRHTFMVRFDAGGKVTAIDQVLTGAQTAKIAWGQATREDVRKTLGGPAQTSPAGNGGEMWDYAAMSTDGHPRKIRLIVTFDSLGRAVSGGESFDVEEIMLASDAASGS